MRPTGAASYSTPTRPRAAQRHHTSPHRIPKKTCRRERQQKPPRQAAWDDNRAAFWIEIRAPPPRSIKMLPSMAKGIAPISGSQDPTTRAGPHRQASTLDRRASAAAKRRHSAGRLRFVSTSDQHSFGVQSVEDRAFAERPTAGTFFSETVQRLFHRPK